VAGLNQIDSMLERGCTRLLRLSLDG